MKFPLLFLLTFYFQQYNSFTNPEKDYSLDVVKAARYKRPPASDQKGYTDMFTVFNSHTNTLEYSFLVSKTFMGKNCTSADIMAESFQKDFLSACLCSIQGVKEVSYKNVKGVLYQIKAENGSQMVGYSFNVSKGNFLYNLTFVAKGQLSAEVEGEYKKLVNSWKVLK